MKINRLLRDNDLFEEEKHRKKNLKLKKFEVTKIQLSGRKYATLSMSYFVEKILFESLNTKSNNESKLKAQ